MNNLPTGYHLRFHEKQYEYRKMRTVARCTLMLAGKRGYLPTFMIRRDSASGFVQQ